MLSRMVGAALLRSTTYEEVEHDRSATRQAVLVVILLPLSFGVGIGLLGGEAFNVIDLAVGVIGGVLEWVVWTLMIWMVGKALALTTATATDWGHLARGTGFAQITGIFRVLFLLALPGASLSIFVLVALLGLVWLLAAMVVAVRLYYTQISDWGAFLLVFTTLVLTLLIFTIVDVPGVPLGIGGS